MIPWQKLFLKAAGFGAGFAAFLVAAIAGWQVFQSLPESPKPWNRDAIKATYAELFMNTGDRPVATFRYALENTTPRDYYLPSDPKAAFVVLPDGKVLTSIVSQSIGGSVCNVPGIALRKSAPDA